MEDVHLISEEMTPEEMHRLLNKLSYGRLGMSFENEVYVVPVSHIYDGERIWFHVSRYGKKTTYLQANPQGCFQADELAEGEWGSVICYGTFVLTDSLEARGQFLKLATGLEPSHSLLQQADMFICTLAIDEMTGRRTPGYSI